MTKYILCFFVPGIPRPGGSKNAVPYNDKAGRARVRVFDACKKNKSWRETVAAYARKEFPGMKPLTGTLEVTMVFCMPRPKSHYRMGEFASLVKSSAPFYHTKKPDVTKLCRSTEDALTGILWVDDAQIAKQVNIKIYDDEPGVTIEVKRLD